MQLLFRHFNLTIGVSETLTAPAENPELVGSIFQQDHSSTPLDARPLPYSWQRSNKDHGYT